MNASEDEIIQYDCLIRFHDGAELHYAELHYAAYTLNNLQGTEICMTSQGG